MMFKVFASIAISLLGFPVFAEAGPNRIVLDENLSLSAVCWQEAREKGWLDVSHHPSFVVASDYELFVRLNKTPDRPFPFSTEPFQFRLVVRNFPCFYEYETHQYRLHGTDLLVADWRPSPIKVRGVDFPGVGPSEAIAPIIEGMLDQCSLRHELWVTPKGGDGCTQKITNDLITATTSISIFSDSSDPNEFTQVFFIRGFPYIDGEPLYPFQLDINNTPN